MTSPATKLKNCWSDLTYKIRNGISPADLNAFESKHDVVLPDDFKDYLKLANGYDGMGSDLLEFMPLDRMEIERVKEKDGDIVTLCNFVDYSIAIHFISLCMSAKRPGQADVVIWSGGKSISESTYLASSFGSFVDLYIENPARRLAGMLPLKSENVVLFGRTVLSPPWPWVASRDDRIREELGLRFNISNGSLDWPVEIDWLPIDIKAELVGKTPKRAVDAICKAWEELMSPIAKIVGKSYSLCDEHPNLMPWPEILEVRSGSMQGSIAWFKPYKKGVVLLLSVRKGEGGKYSNLPKEFIEAIDLTED